MAALVLDCSVALAMVWPAASPERRCDPVRAAVEAGGALVPAIWSWEVAAGLARWQRRGKLTAAQREAGAALLAGLPITAEDAASPAPALTDLALAHGIGLYDAAYLALAAERALPLATFDKALARAAQARGLTVLP